MFIISPHGDVAGISMNRPPVNAINQEFIDGLIAAIEEALAGGARGVVLSGREGLFSAGLDVPELIDAERKEIEQFWEAFFFLMNYLVACPVPVAAAITGHAPAGGAVLALHCDYRVATRGEFGIGLNEVSVGLPVPRNILYTLQRVVGARQADLLVTSAAMLSPDAALQAGFVDELADPNGAVDAALAWLDALLALPPVAMNSSRLAAKSELLEKLTETSAYVRIATDAWFSDETRRCMRELVAKLKA